MSHLTTAATDGTGSPDLIAGAHPEIVTVLHLIAGTVVEDRWEADRITFQRRRGTLLVNLWRDGRRVEQISYADAPRFHRVLIPQEDTP